MPAAKGSPSQPDQNEQNSKLTDGAYFLLDGYPCVTTARSGVGE